MFSIQHRQYKDEVYKVYAVQGIDKTLFLIWYGEWTWVSAEDYQPYVERDMEIFG